MDTANKFSNIKALLYDKYGSAKKKKNAPKKKSVSSLDGMSIGKKGLAL